MGVIGLPPRQPSPLAQPVSSVCLRSVDDPPRRDNARAPSRLAVNLLPNEGLREGILSPRHRRHVPLALVR